MCKDKKLNKFFRDTNTVLWKIKEKNKDTLKMKRKNIRTIKK